MARTLNLAEARRNLSRLVEDAAAGEEIILAKAGRPLARLVPLELATERRLGFWRGQVRVSDDFDAPLPDDMLDSFEGGGD